ncbi:MAG: hypothetical protein QOJ42_1007 [Acidobacteriaceae bacterium]|jgi:hypothetical protein|nr:hypothetical protein [Acidobacteriaceae bacterium]
MIDDAKEPRRATALSEQWSISRRVEQNVRSMGEVMSAP